MQQVSVNLQVNSLGNNSHKCMHVYPIAVDPMPP